MDIQYAVHKFGAYFFKPVTGRILHSVGVEDSVIKELGTDPRSDRLLYLMGVAANEWHSSKRGDGSKYLSALDDFSHPVGYDYFSGSVSLLWSLGEHYVSDGLTGAVCRTSVSLLEKLITSVGVAETFTHTKPGHVPLQMLEIRARLDTLSNLSVNTADVPITEEPPVEQTQPEEQPVAPQEQPVEGVPTLTRKEVLDLLQTERECVIRAETCSRDCSKCSLVRDSKKLITMYDVVIKLYKSVMKQNRKGKYVHMADGTRKWLSNEKAAEMLKLPIPQRVL